MRGGRGGIGSASQKQRIGGQEVSWEYDPELEVDDKPRRTYPVSPAGISLRTRNEGFYEGRYKTLYRSRRT